MNPVEIVGEVSTFDSALVRGWRWLLSPSYRSKVGAQCRTRRRWVVAVGVFETVLMMAAEVVAIVFLVAWFIRL